MPADPFPLEVIQIASPCKVPWDSMQGDERVRRCGECELPVYNLAEMTRDEAETLINTHQGRLCARFYRRPDGTILTADCPVAWWDVRWHTVRLATVAASLFGLLFLGLYSRLTGGEVPPASAFNPFARLQAELEPPQFLWGDVCIPTPPPAVPVARPSQAGPPPPDGP